MCNNAVVANLDILARKQMTDVLMERGKQWLVLLLHKESLTAEKETNVLKGSSRMPIRHQNYEITHDESLNFRLGATFCFNDTRSFNPLHELRQQS